ncbi:ATPase [Tersicoccus phoenicis]|uniref:ATPase n=1 Tax=Tersicoccus phoenicis TaxID=554083 RepID=A0A1R1L8J1_9MICC|nr:AAA family ATPase [Tersicoccus phoenicis]OMH23837.1 ATPase [Tersicoccus phoenicis]
MATNAHPGTAAELTEAPFAALTTAVLDAIGTVIDGKAAAARTALTVLLAEGHLLLEDVPGVGKTLLARSLARTVDATVTRIQFTPDLLPSDVTGVSIFDQRTTAFEFRPGPVFAHLVIADEINRASAKTQSAMLECMEERQVTADGVTHSLPEPFMVVATQNPLEMEGTYALPEAQRDRFMARVALGYPDESAEVTMLRTHQAASPLEDLRPVIGLDEVGSLIRQVRAVYVSDAVHAYVVRIGTATRAHAGLALGASPRALLHLLRAAKAEAALSGRDYVLPDDVARLASTVLAHRLVPVRRSTDPDAGVAQILDAILGSVPVESGRG